MQPNDARQGQGHRLPKDSVCPSPSNVLRLIFHSAGAEAQHGCVASFLLDIAFFAARLSFSARARYLQVFNNSFQYDTNSINSVLILTQWLTRTSQMPNRLSAARAAHTRANSLLVVELRAAIVDGRRGQLIVRTKSLARFFVLARRTHWRRICCAGSGPRAPLLLRESTRIKGDKAGIRKQRPHATVASPPSVRPRHVRRTS